MSYVNNLQVGDTSMTVYPKKGIINFFVACFFVYSLLLQKDAGATQDFNFVFLADSIGNLTNPVNTSILNPIVSSILAINPEPSVVIFGGDGVFYAGTSNLNVFKSLFTDRIEAVGIPTAFAIGNHEIDSLHPFDFQNQFAALFNSRWTQNGPAGYTNLTFSFEIGNSLFVITDDYYVTNNSTIPDGYISSTQQTWINTTIAASTAAHKFVFGHTPAYYPYQPTQNTSLATFWSAIAGNADVYFCGHMHLYYRTNHDGTYQVISGDAGSPHQPDDPSSEPYAVYPTDVYSSDYNYTKVSIVGRYINITVLSEINQTIDYFQFFDNSGTSNSVITNSTPITSGSTGILASSGNTITNNSTMTDVFTGIDATFNNVITNNGSIAFASGGNGIHVYDNNTIVNALTGTISGSGAGAWGVWVNANNNVTNAGNITVSGTNSVALLVNGNNNTIINTGTLAASGDNSFAIEALGAGVSITNSGSISGSLLFSGGANSLNTSGTVTGSGYLLVLGGTLQVSGTTAYTGGTYLYGGALQVQSDASLGAASGALTLGAGQLTAGATFTSSRTVNLATGGGYFDTNGNDLTLNGQVSGSGGLYKLGAGTLYLQGVTTYTGDTVVGAGLVNVTGTLLSANYNVYAGAGLTLSLPLDVSGQIKINGTLITPALTVESSATLSGSGTIIGNVVVSGMVSPGNSPGTLTILGNYSQNPGSTLYMEITPTAYDHLVVSGTASLGGTLTVAPSPAFYPTGSTWTILTAAGGVSGSFANVITSGSWNLIFNPTNTGTGLSIALSRLSYATAGQSAKAVSVGAGFDGAAYTATAEMAALLGVLDFSPPALTNYAMTVLSPEAYDAYTQAFLDGGRALTAVQRSGLTGDSDVGSAAFASTQDVGPSAIAALAGPNAAPLGAQVTPGGEAVPVGQFGAFLRPLGMHASQQGSANQSGYETLTGGLTGGVLYRPAADLTLGFAPAFMTQSVTLQSAGGGQGTIQDWSLALLGAYRHDAWRVDAVARVGINAFDSSRTLALPTVARTAKGHWNGWNTSLSVGGGYDFTVGEYTFGPIASLEWQHVSEDAFSETRAGTVGQRIGARNNSSLQSVVGGRIFRAFETTNGTITPEVRLAWGAQWLGETQGITASFLGAPLSGYRAQTADHTYHSAILDAGVTLRMGKALSASARAGVELFRTGHASQAVSLGLLYSF